MRFLFFLFAVSLAITNCKKTKNNLSENDADTDHLLDMEFQEFNPQGPIANLFSVSFGVPIFVDGRAETPKKALNLSQGFKTPVNPIEVAINMIRQDSTLNEAISAEYAGLISVNRFGEICEHLPCSRERSRTSSDHILRRFYGYCLSEKVYALQALGGSNGDQEDLTEDTDSPLQLKTFATMPQSYRPDIKGCRERFLELINVKVASQLKVSDALTKTETLNFAFTFIPGYSGVENISNGNVVAGTAEIVADIATLGLASKMKISWRSLQTPEKIYNYFRRGLVTANVVANTVRVGSIVQQINAKGARISDVTTMALLVLETGFVLTRIKIKPGAISTKVTAKMRSLESLLDGKIGTLGKKVIQLEPGNLSNIFTPKNNRLISDAELRAIKELITKGGNLTFENLQALMSKTTLMFPDSLPKASIVRNTLEIRDENKALWGYVGFPGLSSTSLANKNDFTWAELAAQNSTPQNPGRDTFVFMVGQAADIKKLPLEVVKGTSDAQEIKLNDFNVFFDGTKSLLLVRGISPQAPVHLSENKPRNFTEVGSDAFLTYITPIFVAVLTDGPEFANIDQASPLASLGSLDGIQWRLSDE